MVSGGIVGIGQDNSHEILGRIAPNALSDRIGVFNTMAPITVSLGICVLCMLAVQNKIGIIIEGIFTGFLSGIVVALPRACLRMLTEDKSMIGTRVGQGFGLAGFGLLIGGPSGGAILGRTQPLDWTGVWVYGGVAGIVGGLIILIVRIMKVGTAVRVKV